VKIPSKQAIIQFVKYNIGGAIFFLSAYGIFSLLFGVFHWPWWLAKTIGDGIGWFINYLIQRYWAFAHTELHFRERKNRTRYILLIIIDTILGYVIVGVLQHFGLSPFIGVWASSIFFTFWNYVLYRYWVFAAVSPQKTRNSRTKRVQ
jgi:putative flippase GtrA